MNKFISPLALLALAGSLAFATTTTTTRSVGEPDRYEHDRKDDGRRNGGVDSPEPNDAWVERAISVIHRSRA